MRARLRGGYVGVVARAAPGCVNERKASKAVLCPFHDLINFLAALLRLPPHCLSRRSASLLVSHGKPRTSSCDLSVDCARTNTPFLLFAPDGTIIEPEWLKR